MPTATQQNARLQAIAEISRAVMEKRYLDDLLKLILTITANVTDSEICSLLLLDKAKKELVLRAAKSESGRYNQKSNTPLGKGIAGRAALENRPIQVSDVRNDSRFLNKRIAIDDGLVSLLSVPMSAEGEVVGVINCYTSTPYEFTEEDVHLLTAVAGQAAILVKNTELRVMKEVVEKELEERKQIDRAKEIIMDKKGISGKAAYSLLRRKSMNARMSMAKIAESIILAATFD